jgi:hypothetical protein
MHELRAYTTRIGRYTKGPVYTCAAPKIRVDKVGRECWEVMAAVVKHNARPGETEGRLYAIGRLR